MTKYKKFIGTWNPENQKEIAGKVRAINSDYEMKGYSYIQYVLETEDSIVSVLGSTVLDRILKDIKIEVGDIVKITFLGMKKGENKEYKDFEISLGEEEIITKDDVQDY